MSLIVYEKKLARKNSNFKYKAALSNDVKLV